MFLWYNKRVLFSLFIGLKGALCKMKKVDKWLIAGYLRLSRDDGNDVSLSIVNQKRQVETSIIKLFENEPYELQFFIDDGFSGSTEYDRPSFQQMLAAIDKNKVNCVVVKDLSRAFRNEGDQSRFLTEVFVKKNVRFISLDLPFIDSYEDPGSIERLDVKFQGLLNAQFCQETSIKIRNTFNTKRANGLFIGAFCKYGFKKNPDDKNQLLIDEEAASVIRKIADLYYYDLYSTRKIALTLNNLGIPNPTTYKKMHGYKLYNNSNDNLWTGEAISRILSDEAYVGTLIQGKSRVISHKVHKKITTDKDEWFRVENALPPILDKDLFDGIQELLQKNRRTTKNGENHIFSGLLRCADCKSMLRRKTSKNLVYFCCRSYTDKKICSRHSIREDVLKEAVLATIKNQIDIAMSMNDIVKMINSHEGVNNTSLNLNSQLKLVDKQLQTIKDILFTIYDDYKMSLITRDEYFDYRDKYLAKEKTLQNNKDTILIAIENYKDAEENEYLTSFLKYKNITSLSAPLLNELIECIYVHEDQSITIDFKYKDSFELIVEYIQSNPLEN